MIPRRIKCNSVRNRPWKLAVNVHHYLIGRLVNFLKQLVLIQKRRHRDGKNYGIGLINIMKYTLGPILRNGCWIQIPTLQTQTWQKLGCAPMESSRSNSKVTGRFLATYIFFPDFEFWISENDSLSALVVAFLIGSNRWGYSNGCKDITMRRSVPCLQKKNKNCKFK